MERLMKGQDPDAPDEEVDEERRRTRRWRTPMPTATTAPTSWDDGAFGVARLTLEARTRRRVITIHRRRRVTPIIVFSRSNRELRVFDRAPRRL